MKGKPIQYFPFSYPEPSPEEKLQKLHTDIKFALKVDNPVSYMKYSFPSVCVIVEP